MTWHCFKHHNKTENEISEIKVKFERLSLFGGIKCQTKLHTK